MAPDLWSARRSTAPWVVGRRRGSGRLTVCHLTPRQRITSGVRHTVRDGWGHWGNLSIEERSRMAPDLWSARRSTAPWVVGRRRGSGRLTVCHLTPRQRITSGVRHTVRDGWGHWGNLSIEERSRMAPDLWSARRSTAPWVVGRRRGSGRLTVCHLTPRQRITSGVRHTVRDGWGHWGNLSIEERSRMAPDLWSARRSTAPWVVGRRRGSGRLTVCHLTPRQRITSGVRHTVRDGWGHWGNLSIEERRRMAPDLWCPRLLTAPGPPKRGPTGRSDDRSGRSNTVRTLDACCGSDLGGVSWC